MTRRKIVVLGSTGSIGTQTLDICERLGADRVAVVGLVARRDSALLAEQAVRWGLSGERVVAVEREGSAAMTRLAMLEEADTVVIAVAGAAGLAATLAACAAGKRVCIATKEVLVAAGVLVTQAARDGGAMLLPIDSEHSALFQCLAGYDFSLIDKLHITASGGPFRTWTNERIQNATLEEALNHPTWRMGGKITIDSATLMNKGLEIIEACWLYGVGEEKVEVVVHPQSIIHSFVELRDGALLAQLGLPDMRLPIQIALLHPEKVDTGIPRLKPTQMRDLTFEAPDHVRFPAITLARQAFRAGGTAPAILNAANEAAVGAFLEGKLRFGQILERVADALGSISSSEADTLGKIVSADAAARRFIAENL
ncbi:1-deoxy-D-xylulose-5-phosphate reductoisomerase [Armatimonas sp.]|uniref:1-deoxy-D-xylulose-5-phosphate reductoisomerase n=1 Tax=Armatimonas sp. TaxID=1872638 RepID=UPI0037510D20